MELRELILSTLAEIEEELVSPLAIEEERNVEPLVEEPLVQSPLETHEVATTTPLVVNDEVLFLEGTRERLLVLFEGLQSPDVVKLEDKMDLTLDFLAYFLATIEQRLECYEKGIK